MIMNVGLLLVLMIAVAYIMIPPLFMKGRYLEMVRERYGKVIGGSWTRRKNITFESGAAFIIIFLVIMLTYLASK
jgi:hypothetical protein